MGHLPRPGLPPQALAMLGQMVAAESQEQSLRALLGGIGAIVDCDLTAVNRVRPQTGGMAPQFHPSSPWADPRSALAPHVRQHPLISHYSRLADPQARRTTDLISLPLWLASPVYEHVFRPQGLRYQLGWGRRGAGGVVAGLTVSRATSDFGESDRAALTQVAPLAIALQWRFPDSSAPAALTTRERQICRLMAVGLRPTAIAEALGISKRTVDKHLEHAYTKLGVGSRSEMPAALLPPPGAARRAVG